MGTTSSKDVIVSKGITICVASWNLGNYAPNTGLEEWLPQNNCDLYVIGVQEPVFTPDSSFKSWQDELKSKFSNHIGNNFTIIKECEMEQMQLIIYARKKLAYDIKHVTTQTLLLQYNAIQKFSLGISLTLKHKTFCFICAHLFPHVQNFVGRNEAYHNIIKNMKFDGKSVIEIENAFIFGDLNYRLEGISFDKVISYVTLKEYPKLLEFDQLNREKFFNNAFTGFEEGYINFPPTYKFEKGQQGIYTKQTSDPVGTAIPSYCDRILYKSTTKSIWLKKYTASENTITSDHIPIYAEFVVDLTKDTLD